MEVYPAASSAPCSAVEEQDSAVSSYQGVPWDQEEPSCSAAAAAAAAAAVAAAAGKPVEDVAYSELANPLVHRYPQLAS